MKKKKHAARIFNEGYSWWWKAIVGQEVGVSEKKRDLGVLKVGSAVFLIVCFVCLQKSTFETKKSFYFTLKILIVPEKF